MARRSVTFTQFRNQATTYLDAVEKGDTLEIFRHGKPVAIVSPAAATVLRRWREARPVKLRGVSLTQAVLAERRQAK